MESSPVATVVVPAHDEERVIDRCLSSLAAQPGIENVEVIVVANGCSDQTVRRARQFERRLPRLIVIDHPVAGKVGALNEGDRMASASLRIYLDADIELGPGALPALIETLSVPDAVCASPRVEFDLGPASGPVSAYYRAFQELPYVQNGLVGLGVYGLSGTGRSLFDEFPDVIADDLFVQRLFESSARLTAGGTFTVSVPRVMRDLVRVRTRVAQGNTELAAQTDVPSADASASTLSTMRALVSLVLERPSLLGPAVAYVFVTLLARWRAPRVGTAWHRDESSRVSSMPPPSIIDGVAFDSLTHDEVVDRVMSDLARGEGGLILTPNVDILRQLRQRPELAKEARLVVADGMPIVWAGRLQGTPLPERVTGADLVWSLSAAASRRGRRIFLFGAAPGVADRAAAALSARHPDLEVAGVVSPRLGFDSDPTELARLVHVVRSARPDIVFVALGFPKQEHVALAMQAAMPEVYFLGCGGALDMAAGDVNRAHGLLQRVGAEWLARLAQEPRRLARRYLVDGVPYAGGMLARAALRRAGWRR